MPHLKNRLGQIPWGMYYHEPVTGWRARRFTSFDSIVRQLIEVRKAHPHLAEKHKWATDYETVANEVDAFNALICEKAGWNDYIIGSGDIGGSAPVPLTLTRPAKVGGGVVAGVKRLGAGISLVIDWLGDDLIPVHVELAEKRAAVCVTCPQNQDPNFLATVTGKVAEEIRQLIATRNEMELRTSKDADLNTCAACQCYIPLKIHAKLAHILEHTSPEIMAKLDKRCWIISEHNAAI